MATPEIPREVWEQTVREWLSCAPDVIPFMSDSALESFAFALGSASAALADVLKTVRDGG